MVDSKRVPRIITHIYEREDGVFYTKILFDGIVVREEPTHSSQIRPKRRSCLWSSHVVEDKTFKRETCKR